ncbi:hypothetical protein IW21_06835 [Campylobacter fetus subsp. venerealis]|nr:hypothetical protein IW21_06835 [Campylobacter fetus subsp. venerealis]PHJ04945.1 hypothetical protein IW23_07155 [Campylobacter fetus subsp. venerealis]
MYIKILSSKRDRNIKFDIKIAISKPFLIKFKVKYVLKFLLKDTHARDCIFIITSNCIICNFLFFGYKTAAKAAKRA